MQLFDIAFNNIKKNLKNYFLYIFSITFSVAIYFIFKSIEYNSEISKVLLSASKLNDAFKASAIVIAIFSIIFVMYSNGFFIRKRKKEIGLYSLLGIEKKQVGRMLFYETLAIGIIALVLGIVIGIVLSKLFIGILIKLIGIPVIIKFTVSLAAVKETAIVFFILFIVVSVKGYSIIYRYELIDLFKAESKGQKEPKASFIMAILALILIVSGYFIYYIQVLDFMLTIMVTLLLVVLGTYIFFDSCIVFVIKASKKNQNRYFKGLNMIAASQLLYRIKGNAKTLATIAVLSASTLTTMGVSVSYYKYFSQSDNAMPFSYVSTLKGNEFNREFKKIVKEYKNNNITKEVHANYALLNAKIQNREMEVNVLSESQLMDIFKARNLKYDLKKLKAYNEIIMFDEIYNSKYMSSYINKNATIYFNNSNVDFKIVDFRDYPLFNQHILYQTIIVSDNVYEKYSLKNKSNNIDAYIIDNQKNSENLDNEVKKLYKRIKNKAKEDKAEWVGSVSSYYSEYKEMSSSKGVMLFIGTFLGLLFLICTGSIIFFKQLKEAQEEVQRYGILRKVGADNKEIKVNIYKQMLFVFLTPFVVGTIHSLVAVSLFAGVFKVSLLDLSISSIIPYLVVYLVYYFVTSSFYYKTVMRQS